MNCYVAQNLSVDGMSEGKPWEWYPDPAKLEFYRSQQKQRRRAEMLKSSTVWQVYSTLRGRAPRRISKDNPPVAIVGWAADYDAVTPIEEVLSRLDVLPEEALPQFAEKSLGGKLRLLWMFERPVLVPSVEFATDFLCEFAALVKAPSLLAGYDPSSTKPAQVWTNGGEWYDLSPTPVKNELVMGVVMEVSKKSKHFGVEEIPLQEIAAAVEETFPGRWVGEFKLDATGVRFWDPKADNPSGCQIKPDGMLCFTGRVPFVSWGDILGHQWVAQRKALNLGKAAEGIYWDGKVYWQFINDRWQDIARSDLPLLLAVRGVSRRIPKGAQCSDLDQVIAHIQTSNRITGAAPLVNQPTGLVELSGDKLINIANLHPVEPSPAPATTDDFPWIWYFLNNHFARPERNPLPHFLSWLRRAYISVKDHKRLPGQALFLCGPKRNGKTLLGLRIVQPLLGNRVGTPYDWMTGKTSFNEELFSSFLWFLDDENETKDENSKRLFASRIKSCVVCPVQTYSPKFQKRVSLEWVGRLFVTLNDDPQSVGLLPEVNTNTEDKMLFFASKSFPGTFLQQDELEATIARELPFFARWLLTYDPGDDVDRADSRVGTAHYFDPHILDLSRQQASAYNLQELLAAWQQASWDPDQREWCGTPTSLLALISITPGLENVAREWTVQRLAKALTILERTDGAVVRGAGREFRIAKS